MRGFPRHHQRGGFTLIEVMLAMAIAALVLLAIHSVFFGALRMRNATDRLIDDRLALQNALDLVAADLRGAMRPAGVLTGDFQTDALNGLDASAGSTPIGPSFVTSSGLINNRSPFSEAQRVSYALRPADDQADGFTLCRVVDRNLLPVGNAEPAVTPILDHVQSAGFEYCDGTAWSDSWDSSATNTLPTAVRFWLNRTTGGATPDASAAPIEIVVPILTATAASAATTTGDAST
jgi:general secretion pathway protein J